MCEAGNGIAKIPYHHSVWVSIISHSLKYLSMWLLLNNQYSSYILFFVLIVIWILMKYLEKKKKDSTYHYRVS